MEFYKETLTLILINYYCFVNPYPPTETKNLTGKEVFAIS
jgi:hypothetical protein